jgi:hypothetical protein
METVFLLKIHLNATLTNLAEELNLILLLTVKMEKSLINLVGA